MLFSIAGVLSICSVLKDRLDGLWSRSLNIGVSVNEILAAHIFTQMILNSIQFIFNTIAVIHAFDLKNNGDNITLITLLLLIQFAGTTFGILVSVTSKNYNIAGHTFNCFIMTLTYLSGK